MTTAVGTQSGNWSASSTSGARLMPGFALGDYKVGQPMFSLRISDAYRAEGPKGVATLHVIHAALAVVSLGVGYMARQRTTAYAA